MPSGNNDWVFLLMIVSSALILLRMLTAGAALAAVAEVVMMLLHNLGYSVPTADLLGQSFSYIYVWPIMFLIAYIVSKLFWASVETDSSS